LIECEYGGVRVDVGAAGWESVAKLRAWRAVIRARVIATIVRSNDGGDEGRVKRNDVCNGMNVYRLFSLLMMKLCVERSIFN